MTTSRGSRYLEKSQDPWVFWEHDLQPGGGNHLVITLGANLLTLFGSK